MSAAHIQKHTYGKLQASCSRISMATIQGFNIKCSAKCMSYEGLVVLSYVHEDATVLQYCRARTCLEVMRQLIIGLFVAHWLHTPAAVNAALPLAYISNINVNCPLWKRLFHRIAVSNSSDSFDFLSCSRCSDASHFIGHNFDPVPVSRY